MGLRSPVHKKGFRTVAAGAFYMPHVMLLPALDAWSAWWALCRWVNAHAQTQRLGQVAPRWISDARRTLHGPDMLRVCMFACCGNMQCAEVDEPGTFRGSPPRDRAGHPGVGIQGSASWPLGAEYRRNCGPAHLTKGSCLPPSEMTPT